MARMARLVVPNIPHHVTQRGNGRARTFFSDEDYAFYRDLLAEHCAEAGVEVWGWVLMPNHVHLILTPSDEDGLRRALNSGAPRDASVCTAAARSGNVDVLHMALNCGAPRDASLCTAAARTGNEDVLRMALNSGAPRDASLCTAAARSGNLDVLRMALNCGSPRNKEAIVAAAAWHDNEDLNRMARSC